jgi:hypothetical protein
MDMQIIETKEWTDIYGGWELMRDEEWGKTVDIVQCVVRSDSTHVLVAKSEGGTICSQIVCFISCFIISIDINFKLANWSVKIKISFYRFTNHRTTHIYQTGVYAWRGAEQQMENIYSCKSVCCLKVFKLKNFFLIFYTPFDFIYHLRT